MRPWTDSSTTAAALLRIRSTQPPGALELACHAAVPVAIDPGFLHVLRINFFLEPPSALPYEVEADLLLSPLFVELGNGLYEIDPALRPHLLDSLVSVYGKGRLAQIGILLEQYADQSRRWEEHRELDQAQRLTALAMVDPERAAAWMSRAEPAAGSQQALSQDWFVAMRRNLNDRDVTPGNQADRVEAAVARFLTAEDSHIGDAARRLGEISLLPGADALSVLRALQSRRGLPEDVVDLIAQIRQTITTTVRPPAMIHSTGEADAPSPVNLLDLLGYRDLSEYDVAKAWAAKPQNEQLVVPIGLTDDGLPVRLDLKEAAHNGMGPHGALIGTFDSGKSEAIRTLVLGLAMTHSPEDINFAFVGYGSGAAFGSFGRLPHTSAIAAFTDGADIEIIRTADAIRSELDRRMRFLNQAKASSRREYEQYRAGHPDIVPLPVLLIIIDGVGELRQARPHLDELLFAVVRIGRTLGVHLLVAGVGVEYSALRGLETHLSYRLAMRTGSASDSRALLGVSDAYDLPRVPGYAYLSHAHVSESYNRPHRFRFAFTGLRLAAKGDPTAAWNQLLDPPESVETVAASIIALLEQQHPRAQQLPLAPLATSRSVQEVLGPVAPAVGRGLTVANPAFQGKLRVPIALVDRADTSRSDIEWIDFAEGSGHTAIAGEPGSGKSTLVQTIVAGLALTHTPEEVQFYCLDFGGGQLSTLSGLPHVGGVIGPHDSAQVSRVVRRLSRLMQRRDEAFAGLGGISMATYRQLREAHEVEDRDGDVFLVIDGWRVLHERHGDLEPAIGRLATLGRVYGVHFIVTAEQWSDLPSGLLDQTRPQVELRLADPGQSRFGPKAREVPPIAGRGITDDRFPMLTLVPELESLVGRIAEEWPGPPARSVHLLPAVVPYDSMPADGEPLDIPVGLADDLEPISLNFHQDPHLMVFGESGSGRSSFLRSLVTSIAQRASADQAKIIIVDIRRSLLGVIDSDHLLGYAIDRETSSEYIAALAHTLDQRRPPQDVTAEQLRTRPWLAGRPDCFVVVDDYDLVGMSSDPLAPLIPYLQIARDVGLHLIVANSVDNANVASFQPAYQMMRRLNTPGLLLSGDPGTVSPMWGTPFERMPPGRAKLISRRAGDHAVQLAYLAEGQRPRPKEGSAPPTRRPASAWPVPTEAETPQTVFAKFCDIGILTVQPQEAAAVEQFMRSADTVRYLERDGIRFSEAEFAVAGLVVSVIAVHSESATASDLVRTVEVFHRHFAAGMMVSLGLTDTSEPEFRPGDVVITTAFDTETPARLRSSIAQFFAAQGEPLSIVRTAADGRPEVYQVHRDAVRLRTAENVEQDPVALLAVGGLDTSSWLVIRCVAGTDPQIALENGVRLLRQMIPYLRRSGPAE